MDNALILLEKVVFLFREIIMIQSNFKSVLRLDEMLHVFKLAFVNSCKKIKLGF